jgi:hypothetical protein
MKLDRFKLHESEADEFRKYISVKNWLKSSDIDFLNRLIEQGWSDDLDGIQWRGMYWDYEMRIKRLKVPNHRYNQNIVKTLEHDELLTEYVRKLYNWSRLYPNDKLTEIRISDELIISGKKEIETFRDRLAFIRTFGIYNDKWKDILKDFHSWFLDEHIRRHGVPHKITKYQFKDLGSCISNRVYTQQPCYLGGDLLEERKLDCW